MNSPLGQGLTYSRLLAISELRGKRATEKKKDTETSKLFPLLPTMDSNFISEEAKRKFWDYFRFSVARLVNREHLRIS